MKRRRRRVLIVASLILSLAGVLTLSAKALDLLPGETASPPPALPGAWVKGDARQPASQLAGGRQLGGVDRTQAGHRAQLRPMGQKPWWPTPGKTELLRCGWATVSRYRYRGAQIPSPWTVTG